MEDAFRFADDLGPFKLVHIHRPSVGLKAVVAIDNIACGPAIGAVRMAPDVSTEEAFRLARAMTFKNAAAGLPHGGGKSVIFADPKMQVSDKEQLIRGFAAAIGDLTHYIPGPDMGTDELAMGWIRTRPAAPSDCRVSSAVSRSTRSAPPILALSAQSM
jgi:glutamate dehydrogenase (NAD(P)+)